jgi:hypothetical protein
MSGLPMLMTCYFAGWLFKETKLSTKRFIVALAAVLAAGTVMLLGQPAQANSTQQVNVSQDGVFAFHACPTGTPAADACLTDHLTGTLPGVGPVTGTFEVHIAYSSFGADNCGRIDKHGTFTGPAGTLNVQAAGLFCNNTSIASYNFAILGGTGSYRFAVGAGIWSVPPASSFDGSAGEGAEIFFGTLTV